MLIKTIQGMPAFLKQNVPEVKGYNHYTGKFYEYNTPDEDVDFDVHNNDITPMNLPKNTCAYCLLYFESRNALFQHLGYYNIDIRKNVPKQQYYRKRKQREDVNEINRMMKKTNI